MRLSKLKLAGFKSFVDPTTVLTPGDLVGVVGPNGCGKSNIIDAVRWVLGESRAGALRGESMQDVIFNGSTTRKPVSRASVELVFDNAQGRAAGRWSQFAEIAVRRVLDRSGESSYWINNLHVRRKDVIDLFLGTGLGPRAYAIIEQGMISRIIEARPEDVRGFLEEAAGVTKYKERRRETEGRIADARDNLARVEDIRNELGGQIERLAGQAELAQRYRTLNDALRTQQILLWLLRRNEARAEAARAAVAAAEAATRIEAETARLRELEAQTEHARQAHYAASDALHAAQALLYENNAAVTRSESELSRQRERRDMLTRRAESLRTEVEGWVTQRSQAEADTLRWTGLEEAAALRLEQAQARHENLSERLPAAEDALAGVQAAARSVRHELQTAEQHLRVEETRRAGALRALDALGQRRGRLEAERHSLQAPDLEALARAEAALEVGQARVEQLQAELDELGVQLPALIAAQRASADDERAQGRELAALRARSEALERIQTRAASPERLGGWLAEQGLAGLTPLWQLLEVEAGWETAVETALRERLNGLCGAAPGDFARIAGEPPASVAMLWPVSLPAAPLACEGPGAPLSGSVRVGDPAWRAWVDQALGGLHAVEDVREHLATAAALPRALWLVDRAGRMLQGGALTLLRPDSSGHGVLERQRELALLTAQTAAQAAALDTAHERLAQAETAAHRAQERLAELRRAQQAAQQDLHRQQLSAVQLAQARDRHEDRSRQIQRDLDEIDAQILAERAHLERAVAEQARLAELAESLRERLDAAETVVSEQDASLRLLRQQEQQLAREVQEAAFSVRECRGKLEELARLGAQATDRLGRAEAERAQSEQDAAVLDDTALQDALQEALAGQHAAEAALAARREAMEAATRQLRELDELRLKAELALRPLGEGVAELRLGQQAAALQAEQYEARLAEVPHDEAAFLPLLAAGVKDGTLSRDINRLTRDIAELGAVNLAAVEELAAAEERKGYLDAQSADLSEAIATLEDAIRRIDRETREQLQATYNTVNRHFGDLFPQLFGGGEAQLLLTGEEILDAGVQIIARPPGKKNSTIHLLSGGEKALTAIALVFSFFQLNPAPFCLLDEVDAPLDDANTVRFCNMVRRMSEITQFLFISHSKITMELARQLVGVTMQEQGVSRVVEVDIEEALRLAEPAAA